MLLKDVAGNFIIDVVKPSKYKRSSGTMKILNPFRWICLDQVINRNAIRGGIIRYTKFGLYSEFWRYSPLIYKCCEGNSTLETFKRQNIFQFCKLLKCSDRGEIIAKEEFYQLHTSIIAKFFKLIEWGNSRRNALINLKIKPL